VLVDSAIPTVVIGAGPYGLSLAAHLDACGGAVRVVGRPMSAWRDHMPSGMYLKSEGYASTISSPKGRGTLDRYCRDHGIDYADEGWPVPLDTFVDYGAWFQRALVPDVDVTDVVSLARDTRGFRVTLASGESHAAGRVVVAVGPMPFARRPEQLFDLPPGLVSHTSDHADLSSWSGRRVTVVGGGQSALESAALLHEHGTQVEVVCRHPLRWPSRPTCDRRWHQRIAAPRAWLGTGWIPYGYMRAQVPFSTLPARIRFEVVGRALGPAGSWWLRDRVDGRISVFTDHRIDAVTSEDGRAVLDISDGQGHRRRLVSDHVLAATGFRVDVASLPFLDAGIVTALRTVHGSPVLSRQFESSVPGLHFTGLTAAATFGPSLRFVCGTRFASGRLARHLAARAAA
jgi:cation diffusion facilitator CzcD-associated flavoprotein CzcO